MELSRQKDLEENLLIAIRKSFEHKKRAEGIHVSDLIDPLKAYYKKTFPKQITEDELGYFFSGKNFEQMVDVNTENLFFSRSESGQWNDIYYEIDFLTKDKEPVELKSTRQKMRYPDKSIGRTKPELIDNLKPADLVVEFDGYVSQLKKYMTIKQSNTGLLYIFFLNLVIDPKKIWRGSAPPRFRCYKLFCTDEELSEESAKMLNAKSKLIEAIALQDPSNLPKCEAWKCKSCKWANSPCETNTKTINFCL